MKSISRHIITCGILFGMLALLGVLSGTLAAAETPTANKTDQKEKFGFGRFISFKDGTLTLKGNHGVLFWNNFTDKTKVVLWDQAAGEYKPWGTAEVLGKVEAEAYVMVTDGKALVRVGARKERVIGTFISYKDDRLLLLGKDLLPIYTKKYGNNLHFNKFAEGIPVYESVDGGDFKLLGTAETVLPTVKEGTTVVVYGEGDDNNTRIELGVSKNR